MFEVFGARIVRIHLRSLRIQPASEGIVTNRLGGEKFNVDSLSTANLRQFFPFHGVNFTTSHQNHLSSLVTPYWAGFMPLANTKPSLNLLDDANIDDDLSKSPMKRTVIFLLLSTALNLSAQDKTSAVLSMESKKSTVTLQKKPVIKPLETGGTLKVIADSDNLISWINLTQPVDEKKEREQVTTNPRTGKIDGFRLFTIRF